MMRLESPEGDISLESLSSPLDDIFVDYLMSKKRESPDLDFKLTIEISRERFPDLAKDFFSMANYGGGYILVGFKERETGGFDPVGLPYDFHVDQADLQQKFNAYSSNPVSIGYREFDYRIEKEVHRFALIHVPASTTPLVPVADGMVRSSSGKEKKVFGRGELLFRRGTQSIRASEEEIEFIEKRSQRADCQISLLTGNADNVSETLYSNLFKVIDMPDWILQAELLVDQIPFSAQLEVPVVTQFPFVYSFENLLVGALKDCILADTIERHAVKDWLADKDRRNIVLWLLDSCLIWEARRLGMYLQQKGKKLFFPLREAETTREESWKGIFRRSSRQVATMMYASQLGEHAGVHAAVSCHFTFIGGEMYLELSPTYVLTWDGRHPRRGAEEGTVITRLSYDDYNKQYLRNLLFWVSKLGACNNYLMLANGLIKIEAEPAKAQIGFGILSDRPGLESVESGDSFASGGE